MKTPDAGDHRVRVAAERRHRMRGHLLHSALGLLAEAGPEAAQIDDIIRLADVSRGTFYKYFDSPAHLVRELAVELAEDMITTVNQVTQRHDDPAVRAALGLRAVLGFVQRCPTLGGFIVRAGWPVSVPGHAFFRLVGPNVNAGLHAGRFAAVERGLALAPIGGICVGSIEVINTQVVAKDFAEQAAEMLLRGLGVEAAEAKALSRLPMVLPAPGLGSLLGRIMAAAETRHA